MQNENSQRLIDFVGKMEECEFKKKPLASSLKDLEVSGLALTQSLRRVIKSFLPLLPVLTKTTDVRIIKNILLSWSNSVADVAEAIELLTNRFPNSEADTEGIRERSGSNEFFIRGATNAHDAAVGVLHPLKTVTAENRVRAERENNAKFLALVAGLEKIIPAVETATSNLENTLRAWHQKTAELAIVLDSARTFVYAMGKLVVLAKMVDSEQGYSQELFDLLEEAQGTCRFLENCLAPAENSGQLRPSLDGHISGGHLKSSSAGNNR